MFFISVYIIDLRIKHSTNLAQRLCLKIETNYHLMYIFTKILLYPLGSYQTSKKASTHDLFLKRVKTNIQIYLPFLYLLEI